MTRVLILGKSGMLGSMVFHYLSKYSLFKVIGTNREEFNAENFLKDSANFSHIKNYDFVINCIGIIKPYCRDDDLEGVKKAIKINALFPHQLYHFCKDSNTKIIQIATDCVFSGREGNYDEDSPHDPVDVYGMTKSLGEVFQGNFLNIRCSIIGPEIKNNLGLLAWFLSQKNGAKVKGYNRHLWNGVTTLQFAELIKKIIEKDQFNKLIKLSYTIHFVPNNSVTKYALLMLFKRVFRKNLQIERVDDALQKNLTLKTEYPHAFDFFGNSSIEKALIELKEYMDTSSNFFKY